MNETSGRVYALGEVAAAATKRLELGRVVEGPKAVVIAGLETAMRDALVASGLHRDEAEAMVKTWSRAWFTSEGTRIIYSVPRPDVDALLPLTITPAPDAIVRVLVGRIEVLTPEREAAVESAVRDRSSEDPAARAAATARLVKLDRFLEPHLRRVLAKSQDATVRKNAEELLAGLKN
jgi:hypothetical protein